MSIRQGAVRQRSFASSGFREKQNEDRIQFGEPDDETKRIGRGGWPGR